jgi:preprotein translocase SecE subunit
VADTESAKQPKRRLRNPETVRERATKAQEDAVRPGRRQAVASTASSATRPLRAVGKVFQYQPFRFIGKVLKFAGRFVLPRYLRNSWRELRLVTWPTGKQTRQLTSAVLLFAIVFGGLVALVDYGLDKLFREVLLK